MKKAYYILSLLLLVSTVSAKKKDKYYDLYNSLNTFGRAYEQLNNGYVNDVNPNELIKQSIKGMVSELDPYTRYEENEGELQSDYLSTGYYIGFGFTVDKVNSKNTIVKIMKDYPADKAGLRIGDELIAIDSIYVGKLKQDSLRTVLLGKSGTKSKFRYYRLGRNDTSEVEITRSEISVKDVPFQRIIKDSIAYIKLDQFSVKADFAFRKALRELEYEGKFSSLILDLRDNPGGVMQASLRILELFMPENTLLLTTRGKLKENSQDYYSRTSPLYPDLKVAVLINENSASASEIVAGAFQDTDRGVIIGRKSYGKGLVQQTLPLDENSKLRMTIAKYYTPSGRCIQKLDYNIDKNKYDLSTSVLFKTKNGRTVNKEDGISPDRIVKNKDYPEIINNLIKSDIIFNFAVMHTAKFENSSGNYIFDKLDFNDFLDFLEKEKRFYKFDELKPLKELSKRKYKDVISSETQDNLIVLESSLKSDIRKSIISNKDIIVELINELSTYILEGREVSFFDRIEDDIYINEAINVLTDKYNNILNANVIDTNEN
ncbi:MAG: S41 family peptidase [Ignavibacteriae bacterium]|nr:S41 family peptidase [Ignavibacteriota bacterium]MCB9220825.1 S41 family peptidase [Ignavibacteria bacterium]